MGYWPEPQSTGLAYNDGMNFPPSEDDPTPPSDPPAIDHGNPIPAEPSLDPYEAPSDLGEPPPVSDGWIAFPSDDSHRRWWSPLLIAVVSFPVYFLVSAFAAVFVVLAISGVSGLGDVASFRAISQSRFGFLFLVVVPQIFLIVPSVAAAIVSPVPIFARLGLVRGRWPVWAWVAAAVGTPLVGMISGAVVGSFLEESESLKEMSAIFRDLGTGMFAFVIAFAIGITPAICEEILFRGYIQTRLTKALPVPVGIFIASSLFAVYHMDPVHIVAVFPLGLYLGWVSYRSGSLFPAMMGHFVNNFLSVLMVVFAPEAEPDVLALPAAVTALSVLGVGLTGLLLTLYASIAFPPHEVASPAWAGEGSDVT